MLTPAQRSVISGAPPGRPRAGLIVGVAAGLGCALIVLGIDMVESVDSARHSVVPFLVALPLALLPVPLLIDLVLLVDQLEPEPPGNLVFCFAWGAGIAALLAGVLNTVGLVYVTQPALGTSNGQFISATIGAPVVERREARRWARRTAVARWPGRWRPTSSPRPSWPWPTSACTAAVPPRGSSRSAGGR